MDAITVHYGDWRPPATVTQTDPPSTWELDHTNTADGDHRRILTAAEHAVLPAGGDHLVIVRPAEQQDLRDQLERWPASMISQAGDRYTIQLIPPAADGLLHDDFDFRTPRGKITCPTSVERVAEGRTKARREAFKTKATPQQSSPLSHLVAEAYTRLDQLEASLNVPPPHFDDTAA